MATVEVPDTATGAERLSNLWDDERCSWEIHYEPAWYSNSATFRLDLEWATDRDTSHQAEWVTYTWQFYAATAEEAIADAVAFCEGLLPFKRCGACDGEGWYGGAVRTMCDECGGTGLANPGAEATRSERAVDDAR